MCPKTFLMVILSALIMDTGFTPDTRKTTYKFTVNDQGILLTENNRPVFFYQQKNKILAGRYKVSNYLHPLFSLAGDTLTEESPRTDHPYHRGIYWAWHQHVIDNRSIGEGWTMESISYNVVNVRKKVTGSYAQLEPTVLWRSSQYQDGRPYIEEKTKITVHPSESDIRKIDFEISLRALVPGVQLGGANDEKGYGGFCQRVKLPDGLIFTSSNGTVTPQNTQIKAGPWMDLSGAYGKNGSINGLTILCHPSTPNYPAPWILRQKFSMQNIVFPGRELIVIPMDKPVVLRYRLIIHNGNATSVDLPGLQSEYEKTRLD
jgi:hypothetical protein